MKNVLSFLLIFVVSYCIAQENWLDSLLNNSCDMPICDKEEVFSRKEKREILKIITNDSIQGDIKIITTNITQFKDYNFLGNKKLNHLKEGQGTLLILFDKGYTHIYNYLKKENLINYKEEEYLSDKINRRNSIESLAEVAHLLKHKDNTVFNIEDFNAFTYYNFDVGDFYYNSNFKITLSNVRLPLTKISSYIPHLVYIKNNQEFTTRISSKLDGDTTYYFEITLTLSQFQLKSTLSITRIEDKYSDYRIEVGPKNHSYFPKYKINQLRSTLTKERNKYLMDNFEMQYDIDSLLKECDNVHIIDSWNCENGNYQEYQFTTPNDTIELNGCIAKVIKGKEFIKIKGKIVSELKLKTEYLEDCFIPTYYLVFQKGDDVIGTVELVFDTCSGFGYTFYEEGYKVRDGGAFINDTSELVKLIDDLFQK